MARRHPDGGERRELVVAGPGHRADRREGWRSLAPPPAEPIRSAWASSVSSSVLPIRIPMSRQPLVHGVGLEYTIWPALCLRCSGIRRKP